MLRFIYVKEAEYLEDITHELIAAAHKNCIPDLKLLCETFLCNSVNADNAFDLFSLAATYNAKVLEDYTFQIIYENKKKLKELITSKPELLQPLLLQFITQ